MKASDSGRKVRPQKGQGKARLGRRRAPGRFGGVKKHGKKVRMLDIAMPNKVRLLALKTLLSARLAEGRIIVVDNDYISERKTKQVADSLDNFSSTDRYLYVSGFPNSDFQLACKNISRMTYTTFDKLSLTEILKNDKLIFNLDGILNLMVYLHEQTALLHKPKAVAFEAKLVNELKQAALSKEKKKELEMVV